MKVETSASRDAAQASTSKSADGSSAETKPYKTIQNLKLIEIEEYKEN